MKIPEEKIQQVRDATDIVEIISQYVTLKKRGKSFVGLCPFHTEKTPSFSVDPVKGFYHCFGCGVGGNVFTFIMEMEKVSFPEALRTLADRAGISLPSYKEEGEEGKRTEELYYINKFAAQIFQHSLHASAEGKAALEYLISRGFNKKIIEMFQIGYADSDWEGLINRCRQRSISLETLNRAGLLIPRKDGRGYYDRFRARIMFPVFSPSGRIIGFGGRTLRDQRGVPKYLNTPETAIYHKGKVFYGLYQSKSAIRRDDCAVLVEGYTDLISMFQHGIENVVATAGTALTEEQANLLAHYTKRVILIFDSDSAGLAAARRAIDILIGAGLNVSVAALPEGSDPDSCLKEEGKEAMVEAVKEAKGWIDFRIDLLYAGGKLNSSYEKAEAARSIMKTVEKIVDPVERNLAIKEIGEKIGVDENLLIRQMGRMRRSSGEVKDSGISTDQQSAESILLRLLIENLEEWGRRIFGILNPSDFNGNKNRLLADELYRRFLNQEKIDSERILNIKSGDKEMVKHISDLLTSPIGDDIDKNRLGLDCILHLIQRRYEEKIEDVRNRMKSAQKRGEDVSTLTHEWVKLKNQLQTYRKKVMTNWKKNVEFS